MDDVTITIQNPMAAKSSMRQQAQTSTIQSEKSYRKYESLVKRKVDQISIDWVAEEDVTNELMDDWLIRNSVEEKQTLSTPESEDYIWYNTQVYKYDKSRAENAGDFYLRTGCQKYHFASSETVEGVVETRLKTYHFLEEWSILWNRLLEDGILDRSRALVKKQPLLVAVLHFYYHPWVLRLSFFLVVYNTLLDFYLGYLNNSTSFNEYVTGGIGWIAFLFLVLFSLSVVNGSLTAPSILEQKAEASNRHLKTLSVVRKQSSRNVNFMDESDATPKLDPKNHTVFQFYKEMRRVYAKVVYNLFNTRQKTPSNRTGTKAKSFYELLEVATEYLETSGEEFVPLAYSQLVLVLFLTVVPLAYFGKCGYEIAYAIPCLQHPTNEIANQTTRYEFYLTAGQTINNLALYLVTCYAGVVMSFLLYGADVANYLAVRWTLRFLPLRRLCPDEDIAARDEGSGDRENTTSDETDSATADASATAGLDADSKPSRSARTAGSHSDRTVAPKPKFKFKHDMDFLKVRIKRDAYERYLFAEYFMQQASSLWGPLIMFTLVTSVALFAYNYYAILYTYIAYGGQFATFSVLTAFSVAGMTFFLIYTLAYANAATDKISNGFSFSAQKDYSLIGDRESWIAYVAEAPIYWYILGFAITRGWLISYFAGAVTAVVGGVALSIVQSDLSSGAVPAP